MNYLENNFASAFHMSGYYAKKLQAQRTVLNREGCSSPQSFSENLCV